MLRTDADDDFARAAALGCMPTPGPAAACRRSACFTDLALQPARQEVHRRRPDEARHEQVLRVLVQVGRRVDLLDEPRAHDRHPVTEGHRLGLIVRHVDHRGPQALLDPRHLRAHLHAQLRVQVRQRLVHQERLRVAHDRAAHRHPLALTTGQIRRLALQMLLQIQDPGRLGRPSGRSRPCRSWRLEREAHVVAHRHMRIQRVVLEHHRDIPIARRQIVHPLAADDQITIGDVLQPRDHPQRRRLPAARRARPGS